jgi:uncharacterized surface protein with fasciclin (FAS1) repeats
MQRSSYILLILFVLVSCKKDLTELDKYQPPDWLKGKLFTQILAQPGLDYFAEALKITEMDTIINTSGLYTVFAPNNDAFDKYFASNPQYDGKIKNIPIDYLERMVAYHIILNSWSKIQFSSTNLGGWIDLGGEKITQRAYKKESLLRDENKKYSTQLNEFQQYTILTNPGNHQNTVYTQSRKYAPVFFKEYFETYNIPHTDYEYYFNRPYTGGLFFCNAQILNEQEIPAENGYIYIIDRVVEPLLTAEEILKADYPDYSYDQFLDLIYEFPFFSPNFEATYRQPGAGLGFEVDTLFNLDYPELAFNIHSEITDPQKTRPTASIQYHNSLFAPTNKAFDEFINTYISGPGQWGRLSNVPRAIKKIIVNSYMVPDIIYKSNIDQGFINGEMDEVILPESSIIQTEFGSNAIFIGLNEAIVPRAFSSVSAPVYLRRGYFTLMNAIEETRILAALKNRDQNIAFFVVPDLSPGTLVDSSLIVNVRNNQISFLTYDHALDNNRTMPISDVRKKILNHIGASLPKGAANIEFVKNLAGNYIVFDNINKTVSGTSPTTFGTNGDSLIVVKVNILDELTDNGQTYEIGSWFSFSKIPMSVRIQSINPKFLQLLVQAGLAIKLIGNEYQLTFLSPGTNYTAFIPSSEALDAYRTDTLTKSELTQFIRNHFIPDHLIFTDGNVLSGSYLTMNSSQNKKMNLSTGPDFISVLNRNGEEHVRIEPVEGQSNLTSASQLGAPGSSQEWNFVTTGVVHVIDKVLEPQLFY